MQAYTTGSCARASADSLGQKNHRGRVYFLNPKDLGQSEMTNQGKSDRVASDQQDFKDSNQFYLEAHN